MNGQTCHLPNHLRSGRYQELLFGSVAKSIANCTLFTLNLVFAILLVSSVAQSALAANSDVTPAEIGKPAPNFSLVDTDGKTKQLSDFSGKIVVLEWFNEGCPFVLKHYQSGNMQRMQNKFTKEGVIWLRVVSSAPGKQGNMSAEEHNEKTAEWKITSTSLLLDPTGSVGQLYGAKTTPHMFIINKDGMLTYEGAIDDRPSTRESDIEGSKNYVDETLSQLLAGETVTPTATKPYGCSVKYAF